MARIRVGLIGSGFVAELHMYAYRRVYGVEVEVAAVVSRGDHVETFARKHRIAQAYRDYRDLLADRTINVIDICTPPALHAEMIVAAMQAGKHVICEKPFTGYFGRPDDKTPIGRHVPKALMYERVMAEMAKARAVRLQLSFHLLDGHRTVAGNEDASRQLRSRDHQTDAGDQQRDCGGTCGYSFHRSLLRCLLHHRRAAERSAFKAELNAEQWRSRLGEERTSCIEQVLQRLRNRPASRIAAQPSMGSTATLSNAVTESALVHSPTCPAVNRLSR